MYWKASSDGGMLPGSFSNTSFPASCSPVHCVPAKCSHPADMDPDIAWIMGSRAGKVTFARALGPSLCHATVVHNACARRYGLSDHAPPFARKKNETASTQTPASQKIQGEKKTLVSRSAHGNSAHSQWIHSASTETPPVRCLRRRPRTCQDASRTTTPINSGPDPAEGQLQTYRRTVCGFQRRRRLRKTDPEPETLRKASTNSACYVDRFFLSPPDHRLVIAYLRAEDW